MDVLEALLTRRSCRRFTSKPVEEEKIMKMLECAMYAPSPANKQPWDFIVVTDRKYHEQLKSATDSIKDKLYERSGWKWLPGFKLDFGVQAPVLIVVVGDPERNGAEQFLDVPSAGYVQACSAAIQNMTLAAHAQGLATLWYSLYEKQDARVIFSIADDKDPIAFICVGYAEQPVQAPPRKPLESKVRFLK